jgi:protein phosphatase
MSNTKYAFSSASLTDVGLVRQLNEDRELILNISQDAKAFIVCDGMGGHDSGDKASEAAVRFISEFLKTKPIENATISLVNAIKFANQQIYFESKVSPTSKGMGTTAVVLLQFHDEILVGHVGDSRAYRFTDNQLTPITKDHSVVQEMVNQGLISQIQAEHHPRKNEITKALGIRDNEEPTVSNNIKAVKGDRFILCSDGLSGLISHEAFTDTVRKHRDPNVCAMKLVQMAKNGGGHDNITVQVIDVIESPNKAQKKSTSKQTIMLGIAAASIGILALTFVGIYNFSGILDDKIDTLQLSKVEPEAKEQTQPSATINLEEWVNKKTLLSLVNEYSKQPTLYAKLINENNIKDLTGKYNLIIEYKKADSTYKLNSFFINQIKKKQRDVVDQVETEQPSSTSKGLNAKSKSSKTKVSKPGSLNKTDKTDKTDKDDITDTKGKTDKTDKDDKTDTKGKTDKTDKDNKTDTKEKTDKSDKNDKTDTKEKTDNTDKDDKTDTKGKTDKSEIKATTPKKPKTGKSKK